jgi:hypothetical protein
MRYLSTIVAAALLAAAGTVCGQDAAKPEGKAPAARQPEKSQTKTLSVGDKAPPLSIEKWVKGHG